MSIILFLGIEFFKDCIRAETANSALYTFFSIEIMSLGSSKSEKSLNSQ